VSGPCVVLLAAGSGRRLGCGPKAHVAIAGATFLERIVRSSREAGIEEVFVVGSHEDAVMPKACEALGVRLAINDDPSRGMSSSVHAGLLMMTTARPPTGALVWPVDVPLVRATTLRLLTQALGGAHDASVHPVYRSASGHPVGLGRDVVLQLAKTLVLPLRDALIALRARRVDVPCDDAGVVTDVNTPKDLAEAAASAAGGDRR
jgi:CTP:molybdopterin cytidylyltransferase MocA